MHKDKDGQKRGFNAEGHIRSPRHLPRRFGISQVRCTVAMSGMLQHAEASDQKQRQAAIILASPARNS